MIDKCIIVPCFTSKDVEKIYYGDEKCVKKRLLYDTILTFITFGLILLFGVMLYLLVKNGTAMKYVSFINSLFNKIPIYEELYKTVVTIPDSSFHFFATVQFSVLVLIKIGVLVLPILLFLKIFKMFINVLNKIMNRIITPAVHPFPFSDYCRICGLYDEAEKILHYFNKSDVTDIILVNTDTIRLYIRDGMISRELEAKFKGLAEEIFKPDKIDFSVLDDQLAAAMEKGHAEAEVS